MKKGKCFLQRYLTFPVQIAFLFEASNCIQIKNLIRFSFKVSPESLVKNTLEVYKISKSADSVLKTYLTEMYKTRDKHFGNARVARSIVNEAIRRQNLRLSRMDPEQITTKIKLTLEASDFLDVINKKNEEVPVRARIGFK